MVGASLEIRKLAKRYGTFEAVRDFSLQIAPGELVTLLGPSGSGKTTVLSAIAGFVTPSAGEILIDGRPVEALPPERRNIGVVFQHYALFPHMTVAENVAFPLEMRAVPRPEIARAVGQALEAVQMSAFSARFPSQLSGGQQQRTAVARAIVFNPPVLLLDEPLSALDKNLRESMQVEIKRLHAKSGLTMIYVTHDQEEALLLSDRVAVMSGGNIEQVATPAEIYDQPCNRFVAAFVGQSNFLDARVLRPDGREMLLRTPGGVEIVAAGRDCREAAGAEVSVMIRPERIAVGEAAAGLANRFRASIAERFFLGSSFKLRLVLPGGESILGSCAGFADRGLSQESGAIVDVGWHARDALIYAKD
jgi:putative spermidine/putrescine transport system ATP-binding protein